LKLSGSPKATVLSCLFLFGLNAWVCLQLWSADYIDQLGSTEGPFLAFSRWITRHWGDLRWFPLWFSGMPFERVYGPSLHWTVAAVATVAQVSVLRSYRLVTAALYCLGPVTLFWLCYRLTHSRGYALAVGVVYSLFSPSALLSSIVRIDLGSLFWPRRYQSLVHYGESPHIAALTLLPLVIWSFHEAIGCGRRYFVLVAAVLFGTVIATNWTGTVGLLMALAAYSISRVGTVPRKRWLGAAAICLLGYMLVSPLVPPSILIAVPRNAEVSDGTHFDCFHAAGPVLLAGMLAAMHFIFERRGLSREFRFFLYFFVVSGFVVLARLWFNVYLMPQPHRFQLEMEMAFLPICLFPFRAVRDRWPRRTRKTLLVLLALFCPLQLYKYREYVAYQTKPVIMENTIEYRAAKWLERNAPGERVFAPGSIALWINVFTDTPQMVGCCDQSLPSLDHRLAFYTVYTGQNAGIHDAEDSILWLKAYGATIIGVPGPASKEFFKAFWNPRKFDSVLPVVWREDDTTLYRVPGRSESLAHVIPRACEVRRRSSHGLDLDPLRPYVTALDDATLPLADMRWLNAHEARIETTLQPGQIVSVQVSYAPGWRATANGAPVPLHSDALGLVIAEPHCNGFCAIDLVYDSPPEAHYTRLTQLLAAALCIAIIVTGRPKRPLVSRSAQPRSSGGPVEEKQAILSEHRCAQNFSLLRTGPHRKLMLVAHESTLMARPSSSAAPAVEGGPGGCRSNNPRASSSPSGLSTTDFCLALRIRDVPSRMEPVQRIPVVGFPFARSPAILLRDGQIQQRQLHLVNFVPVVVHRLGSRS